MRFEDDMLIREVPISDSGKIIVFKRECIITKNEFLACYNKWVKEKENE